MSDFNLTVFCYFVDSDLLPLRLPAHSALQGSLKTHGLKAYPHESQHCAYQFFCMPATMRLPVILFQPDCAEHPACLPVAAV